MFNFNIYFILLILFVHYFNDVLCDINCKFFKIIIFLIRSLNYRCITILVNTWYQLPELAQLENYDKCMAVNADDAVYCIVNIHIKPDNTSHVWNIIEVCIFFFSLCLFPDLWNYYYY